MILTLLLLTIIAVPCTLWYIHRPRREPALADRLIETHIVNATNLRRLG